MPEEREFTNKVPDCIRKLDESLTQQYAQWWNGLTKKELLEFIEHTPTFTAEMIREIFANTSLRLASLTSFDTKSLQIQSDFSGGMDE